MSGGGVRGLPVLAQSPPLLWAGTQTVPLHPCLQPNPGGPEQKNSTVLKVA